MLIDDAPIAVLEKFAVSGPYPPGKRAMACSLEVASNGDLLAAYMESADHHLTNSAVVTLSRSTDVGVTWPEKMTIAAEPGRHCYTNHGMTRLSDGTLLLEIIRGKMVSAAEDRDKIQSRGAFIRSIDNGHTWEEYGEPLDYPFWDSEGRGFSYGKVLELSNGRLMTPVYGVPKGADHAKLRVAAMAFSADGGHSWPEFSVIYEDRKGDINPSETDIIRLSDGRYLAMIRANAAHRLYHSHSDDEGTTWSPIEPTELPGQCPALLTLADGRILCAYRDMRRGECGMSCASSDDLGATWTALGHLYRGGNTDCAYPSMVHLPGGHVYCVNYTASYPEPSTGVCEIRGLLIQDKTFDPTEQK